MRIEPRQLPDTLPFLGDLPPLLTRLYAARGVQSEAELDKSLARLIPFQQLKGIDAAVDLLVAALEQRQRILRSTTSLPCAATRPFRFQAAKP